MLEATPQAEATDARTADGDAAALVPDRMVTVLGVRIANLSKAEAMAAMERMIRTGDAGARGLYIVNAHTLNLAFEDPSYRAVLNDGTAVFGDGTGVRWAARMQGVRMLDNLVGTDLVPELIQATPRRGSRYYLLGATPDTLERAAAAARAQLPEWELAGFHHGYVIEDSAEAIADINRCRPHMLLVGMGNPLQERWIHDHLPELDVPLAVGVGGLFDHWGGNLTRAPLWVRRLGIEWLQILLQQPHKWRRYLIGNWKFLARAARPTAVTGEERVATG